MLSTSAKRPKTLNFIHSSEGPNQFSLRCNKTGFPEAAGADVDFVNAQLEFMQNCYMAHKDLPSMSEFNSFFREICDKIILIENQTLKWHLQFILLFSLDNQHLELSDSIETSIRATIATVRIDIINDAPPSPELNWYSALIAIEKAASTGNIRKENLVSLMGRADAIVNKEYKKAVLELTLEHLNQLPWADYIDADTLSAFADRIVPYGHEPGDYLSEPHHRYLEERLSASPLAKYFDHINSVLMNPHDSHSYTVNIEILNAATYLGRGDIRIAVTLDDFSILRFVSHISEMLDPILTIFPNKPDDRANQVLRHHLFLAGFLNSEHMMIPGRALFYGTDSLPYAVNKEFLIALFSFFSKTKKYKVLELPMIPLRFSTKYLPRVLAENGGRYGMKINLLTTALSECSKSERPASERPVIEAMLYKELELWANTALLPFVRDVLQKRVRLETFAPLHMLALTYQGLKSYHATLETPACPKQEAMVVLLSSCLDVANNVQAIFGRIGGATVGADLKTLHAECFQIAKKIADNLSSGKQTIILQTGDPIAKGDTFSKHAFYVVIKHDAKRDQFDIIIVNGGGKLTSYHYRDDSLAEKEYADVRFGLYHPVTLMSLDRKNVDHQQILAHYIYRVITLAHGPETLTYEYYEGGKKSEAFSALRNIYQGSYDSTSAESNFSPTEFKGFNVKSNVLQRANSKALDSYRAQLSGNCTMRNLMIALGISCGLNRLEAAIFNDALLYSAHNLISEMTTAPRAAGGAGAELPTAARAAGSVAFGREAISRETLVVRMRSIGDESTVAAHSVSTLFLDTTSSSGGGVSATAFAAPR